MDLKESARQWVLGFLPYDQNDAELVTHLNGLDARGLLIVYHNWMSRLVQDAPRAVCVSDTLQSKIETSNHKQAFDRIVSDIEQGESLVKYLSRGVRIAAQLPRADIKFQRRRDLDLMLSSWQMHHLHLSTNVENDGFVTRTDDLLFVVFRREKAYLIDIMPHGSWSKEHLLRTVLDDLPDAQAASVLKDVIGLARYYTEEEHQKLRNAGINTIHWIGDRAVLPAGGITGAGTSMRASRDADDAISNLEGFEFSWADHPNEIREICKESGTELPEEPEFEFVITDTLGAGVIEKKSKAFFPFP